jgi:hypothetical protein
MRKLSLNNILISDFLLALKRPRITFFKTLHRLPHWFGATSSIWGVVGGTENHPHLNFSGHEILKLKGDPSLKNKIKSLLYTGWFSLSPIKPSLELGRNITAILNKKFLLKYLILYTPALKARLLFLYNGY